MLARSLRFAAVLTAAGATSLASGQCVSPESAKLTAPDAFSMDQLGLSVSVAADVAIVGAPNDEFGVGSAYIFQYDDRAGTWAPRTKLADPNGLSSTLFGQSVATTGDVIVIGAPEPFPAERPGVAYVYEKPMDGWPVYPDTMAPTAVLTASDGAANDNFGYSVAIDGNVIVVGAFLGEHVEINNGAAYVFERAGANWSTMTETAKLTPNRTELELHFGVSVATDGDLVVVGADRDGEADFQAGAAFVYRRPAGGWVDATELAKLTSSTALASDRFGLSVDVSGDTVIAGAWGDDTVASKAGAVFVYEKPTPDWTDMTETARLTASDGASGDHLGWSVAIAGDVIVGGAPANLFDGAGNGGAYVYMKPVSGWINATESASFMSADGADNDEFGVAVAASESMIVSGARFHDTGGLSQAGAAYLFAGTGDCDGNGEIDLCEILADPSMDDDHNGVLDVCEASCPSDLTGDSAVNADDLFQLLGAWGACPGCPEDLTGDDAVNADDLFELLGAWGPCS